MVAHHAFLYLEMLQQDAAGARVFCEDKITLFQNAKSPEGDVFEIADGSWDEVKDGHESASAKGILKYFCLMLKKTILFSLLPLFSFCQLKPGPWHGEFELNDSVRLPFHFESKGKTIESSTHRKRYL